MRRAGLDYHEMASVREHADLAACLAAVAPARVFALTTRATRSVYDAAFRAGDAFLFGPETRGLPQEVLDTIAPEMRLRIPMRAGQSQLESVERGGRHGLRSVAAARLRGQHYPSSELIGRRISAATAARGSAPSCSTLLMLLDDRHRHLVLHGHALHGARAVVALDDLADRSQRFARRGAGGEREAEAAIARFVVGAGEDEVAHAGEAHERFLAAAERQAETRHLGEAARDQRDARVRAEPEPVADAGADRVDVLRRAAHLDADDVVRGVGAKGLAADALGEPLRVVGVRRRDRHRRRQSRADLARERRSRKHGRRQAGRQQLRRPPGTAASPCRARSPSSPRPAGAAAARASAVSVSRSAWLGTATSTSSAAATAAREIRRGFEQLGERRVGEIARVAPLALHRRGVRGVASPKRRRMAGARELHRERRAPRPGPDDRDATRRANASRRSPRAPLAPAAFARVARSCTACA